MDVFKDLSFELQPGLTLIRGGDGRGKTGLLQILAGVRKVASGTLHRPPLTVHWVDPQDDRDEAVIASQWLQSRRGAFADWDEAVALTNRLAPEHLQIMTAEPAALFGKIRHAGAAFLGRWCPEALGDYVAGPNHVLPTGRSARFASGLSVFDFLKRTTWVAA
jgi:ATPase subunit of ABC transporter with duplicated ATPase domains